MEDVQECGLGSSLPSRMISWKEKQEIKRQRMSDWRKSGMSCPPGEAPEDSVATAACQNITSSGVGDTWIFTPNHAR